ncbi:hypothetical protein [Wansuia hejianensis]|uniref:Uncharacterized protein n=1 Tax=Wansuia hejianensis TaxID=2763667 RepID=A0A926EXE2_9FIRM|nr:hypothetical protein [Wansuia hejianensis]MBC8590255.1 hypothetical protein [Wansuia hejianensis]
MKINNKGFKSLSIVLALSILTPSIVTASPIVTKEETVYVNLNSSGKETDKTSSIWIHSDSSLDKIIDESILEDIVNIKGDIEPVKENQKLVWDVEDSDIYYQGKVNKELPIQPKIKYYLDGKEVNPEDIVGKKGKLKINISIENTDKHTIKLKDGKTKTAYAPYIVATVVDLPTENFSNVHVNTGKLISDGSNQIVSYVCLPGIKESLNLKKDLSKIQDHLEITADVVDFEMKPIMFAATSEFPDIDTLDSAKDLDELIDGLDKIKEASDKLADATEKLYNGQKELDTGIGKLVDGSKKLNIGSNVLLEGSSKLQEGLNAAYGGSKEINQGANTLASSANELGQGFVGLGDGTIQFSNKAMEFSQGASQVAEGISSIPESTKALEKGMEELISGTETIKNGQQNLANGLGKSVSALEQIKAGKEKESKVIDLLLKGTNGLEQIANGVEKLPGAETLAEKMKSALADQRMALEGIKESSSQLILALNEVEQGLKQAEVAANQLSEGVENINVGQKKINGGLNELSNGTSALKDASNQLVQGSAGLQKGANNIKKNAEVAKSGANKFTAGSKDLVNATGDLSSGLGNLNSGAMELNKGIAEFSKATEELSNGGEALQDGSHKLVDGTKELNEGMNQFNQEGIHKITNEIDNSDLNIGEIIETKDELVKLSKDNHSFSGKSDDMEGKLKFIMKTESIKAEEKEEIEEVKEEVKEEKGFFNWLKGLFNKEN